jgi:hypothetical protein
MSGEQLDFLCVCSGFWGKNNNKLLLAKIVVVLLKTEFIVSICSDLPTPSERKRRWMKIAGLPLLLLSKKTNGTTKTGLLWNEIKEKRAIFRLGKAHSSSFLLGFLENI